MAVKPINVSQLNKYIKRILQTDPILSNISVKGEISNLKYHSSGHVFFSLKDDMAAVRCFLPAGNTENLRFELSEGMEIIAYGYISIYEKGGSYSLNVRDVDVEGMGNLAIAFEKLKEKLRMQGVFDESRKKPIPFFPERIAIVTSPTGAALQDMLKIIRSRNNVTDVLVFPVLVQGENAAGEISHAIDYLNSEICDIDTIIVGRGGGSMEDLWAFNEEIVARSIYDSTIPVISAVGHETDFTISDFAADCRAETPTAAAQMAVPDTSQLSLYISDLKNSLSNGLKNILQKKRNRLNLCDIESFRKLYLQRIQFNHLKLDNIYRENLRIITTDVEGKRKTIDMLMQELKALDPKNIIEKGFAAVIDKSGHLVKNASALNPGENIDLYFSDGNADCVVKNTYNRDD